MEVSSEVWSFDAKARPRNGTPVLDCCWLGSECSKTVSTPPEVNYICLWASVTEEKWDWSPWLSTRLPDAISLERSIRGVACPCSASSSWPMELSDNTMDMKINTDVQLILICVWFRNDDDAIKAKKLGLWCYALNWNLHYRSVSVQSNWAWEPFTWYLP